MMLPKSIAATCKPKDDLPITVALAYDDDAAFRAAKEVYLGVIRSLTVEFEFRDFWWRFDALTERSLLPVLWASPPRLTSYFVARAIHTCCRVRCKIGFATGSRGARSRMALS